MSITGVFRRLAKERRRKPQNGNMVSVQMMCHKRDDNREAKLKKKEYHERKQQVGTEKLSTVTRHISSLLANTKKEAVLGNARRVLISHPRGRKRFLFFFTCAFSSVAPNLRVCVNLYAYSVRVELKKKEQHVMQMPWLAQCSTTAVFASQPPREWLPCYLLPRDQTGVTMSPSTCCCVRQSWLLVKSAVNTLVQFISPTRKIGNGTGVSLW